MSKLSRNADPSAIVAHSRTFFVTTKCVSGRQLLQTDRNALLFVDVLRMNVAAARFQVHDFVIMPDHVHLLISVEGNMTIEKAVQYIKGGFSFRLRKQFGYSGEVWQRGFGDVRIRDRFTFTFLARQKAAGAKARSEAQKNGTTEVVPLHER